MKTKTEYRLTWRGYCAVMITANSRAEAIKRALSDKPKYIPTGTELHFGIVSTSDGAVGFA